MKAINREVKLCSVLS